MCFQCPPGYTESWPDGRLQCVAPCAEDRKGTEVDELHLYTCDSEDWHVHEHEGAVQCFECTGWLSWSSDIDSWVCKKFHPVCTSCPEGLSFMRVDDEKATCLPHTTENQMHRTESMQKCCADGTCIDVDLADPDLQPYENQATPIASSPLPITGCPSIDYATTSEPWRSDLCGCSDDYGSGGDGGFRYDHVSGQGGCSRGCEGGQHEESFTCYAACDEVPVFDTLLCESHAGKLDGW